MSGTDDSRGGLIISVDDYGMTPGVNEAVARLARLGTITATSVMANMPYAEQCRALAAEFPQFSLGAHLTLTEGRPLSPPASVPTLVGPDGYLRSLTDLLARARRRRVHRDDVRREFAAQVRLVRELLGDRLDHWDSHHGVHRFEPFLSAAMDVCRVERIPAMRSHRHQMILRTEPLRAVRPRLRNIMEVGPRRVMVETYYAWVCRRAARLFCLPDGQWAKEGAPTADVLKCLAVGGLPEGVWEVATHPATTTEGLTNTRAAQSRIDEYELLASAAFQNAVSEGRLRLISFRHLLNDRCPSRSNGREKSSAFAASE